MSLVEHARRELELCGQTAEDPEYAESIVNAVAAFAAYGHSGGSAMVGREQLHSLLGFETLSPLTSDPAEWIDRSEISGTPMWQSTRDPNAFSTDGGKTWYRVGEGEEDESFVPPAARDLPKAALDSAANGASALDTLATTKYGRNLIAHALVQLDRDGWLRAERASSVAVEGYEEPVKLYGLWRVDEDPTKTGWWSADGGRVILTDDLNELKEYGPSVEPRQYPEPISHADWIEGTGNRRSVFREIPLRSGPDHYREGLRLLAKAGERENEGTRLFGDQHPTDAFTALVLARARAHFAAAQVAAIAHAEHPDSVSWQEAIGL